MFGLMTKKAHEQRMLDRYHQERHTLDGIQRDAAELNELLKRAEHERDEAQRAHADVLAEMQGLKDDVRAAEQQADRVEDRRRDLAKAITGGEIAYDPLACAQSLHKDLARVRKQLEKANAELKAMRDAEADREAEAEAERAEIERQADPYLSDRPRTVTVFKARDNHLVLHRSGVTWINRQDTAEGVRCLFHSPNGADRVTLTPDLALTIRWDDLDGEDG